MTTSFPKKALLCSIGSISPSPPSKNGLVTIDQATLALVSFPSWPDYKKFVIRYGDLSVLPTKYFLSRPEIGEEFHVELEKGKVLILKLLAVGPLSEKTGQREVFYEMNGEVRQVTVEDKTASVDKISRPKADPGDSSQVGATMAGVVIELRVHEGDEVKLGDPLLVLTAMKMVSYIHISYVAASRSGSLTLHNRKRQYAPPTMERCRICRSNKATRSTVPTYCAGSPSHKVAWKYDSLVYVVFVLLLQGCFLGFYACQCSLVGDILSKMKENYTKGDENR